MLLPKSSELATVNAVLQRRGIGNTYFRRTTSGVLSANTPSISEGIRAKTMEFQLAWLWLRHRPRSALTLWFKDRMERKRNGGRRRKSDDRGAGAKAAGRALEICDRRGRDRRRPRLELLLDDKPAFHASNTVIPKT